MSRGNVPVTAIPPRVIALLPSLGRTNDNEVLATVRAIERVLNNAGLDWHDVAAALQPSSTHRAPRAPTPRTGQPSSIDIARACRDLDGGRLTPRERGFVLDICARGHAWRLTEKQRAWLDALFERLDGRAAA